MKQTNKNNWTEGFDKFINELTIGKKAKVETVNIIAEWEEGTVNLNVDYSMYGGTAPATWHTPAEYPEVEIESVSLGDKKLNTGKWKGDLISIIEDCCYSDFEKKVRG